MTKQTALAKPLIVLLACLACASSAFAQEGASAPAGEQAITLPDLSGFSRAELLQMWYDSEIGTVVYADEIARRDELDHFIAAVAQYVSSASDFTVIVTEGPYACGIGLETFGAVQLEMPPLFVENVIVQDYVQELQSTVPLPPATLFPTELTVEDINLEGLEWLIKEIEAQQQSDDIGLRGQYIGYFELVDAFGDGWEDLNEYGEYLAGLHGASGITSESIAELRDRYDENRQAVGYQRFFPTIEVSQYEPKRQLLYLLREKYKKPQLQSLAERYGNPAELGTRIAELDAEIEFIDPSFTADEPMIDGGAGDTSVVNDEPKTGGDSSDTSVLNNDAEFYRLSYYYQTGRYPSADEVQAYLDMLGDLKRDLPSSGSESPPQESSVDEPKETSSTAPMERSETVAELRALTNSLTNRASFAQNPAAVEKTIAGIEKQISFLEDPVVVNPNTAPPPSAVLSDHEAEQALGILSHGYSILQDLNYEAFGVEPPVVNDRLQTVNSAWRAEQTRNHTDSGGQSAQSRSSASVVSGEQKLLEITEHLFDRAESLTNPGPLESAPAEEVAESVQPALAATTTSTTVRVFVKAKETALQTDDAPAETAVAGALVTQLFPPAALPGDSVAKSDDGSEDEPMKGTSDDDGIVAMGFSSDGRNDSASRAHLMRSVMRYIGEARISIYDDGDAPEIVADTTSASAASAGPNFDYTVEVEQFESYVIEGEQGQTIESLVSELPAELATYIVQRMSIDSVPFVTTLFSTAVSTTLTPLINELGSRGNIIVQLNFCRTKQAPDDPSFVQTAAAGRAGSWGQTYDDQWAIKRVGLTAEADSAWNALGDNPQPVNVAVIDTGLDWNHLDIDWENIWRNEGEIPNNEIDDDGNGYVDDIIGWDFIGQGNKPWDHDGHGTIVSGIIAATQGNGIGIAGINPHANIMVLKSLNAFGNTRASFIAEAILYAVDNGAKLINVSVGGSSLSRIEKAAVDYANSKDVMIVAAAGNEGISLEDYGPGGLPGVLTVSATGLDDARTVFSNWGTQVDIAAPGMEVLSLRARRTDTMRDIPGVEYINAANYVGQDKRYYRVSGTSFAAPIVTGIASLIASREPDVSNVELRRMLTQSAEDVDIPGKDQFTGYGIVDAKLALTIERDFFIESIISGVGVVQVDGQPALQVNGTADASDFGSAWLEIGAGENPTDWKRMATEIGAAVSDGNLMVIPAQEFAGSAVWMLKLVTEDRDGRQRQAWFRLALG